MEVSFLLNEDGTLTAKVFNRENSIRNFGEDIGYTQGVGLSYNVDFDTFKELLRKIFTKKSDKEDDVLERPEKEAENALPDYISVKPASKN
ncbi:hypothetical protein JCM19274_5197 [Algibacter lectus]|uniref:Uncharacterized protein n=1 Tax=Algibacter lectus TaxID=221126 RepID=A0A090WQ60_9FLAO|nr:hypothetical protein JCM19274_5197 [Algibacter lectus]